MNKEEFINEINNLQIDYDEEMLKKLDLFYKFMQEWNNKINLTRIIKEEDVYLKHFYDSLTLCKIIDFNKIDNLLDVGSGAGFPGIVLKIFFPKVKIVLVDSLQKRVNYLKLLIKHLQLEDIDVYHTRIEDFLKVKNEKYDIVVSRALASMPKLITWLSPYINNNGKIICMKANVEDEILDSYKILDEKNLKISNIKELNLPKEGSLRTLIEISKNN